jgi:hypothetical protein
MAITRCTLTIVALFLATQSASSQEPVVPVTTPEFGLSVAGPLAPVTSFGGAASTAHESITRGRAALTRAKAEYNLLTAEALRSLEEARSRHLDNEEKELAVRLSRRRMGQAEQSYKFEQIKHRRELTIALNRTALQLKQQSSDVTTSETQAQNKLRLAIALLNNGSIEPAVHRLVEITQRHAETQAAQSATQILKTLQG